MQTHKIDNLAKVLDMLRHYWDIKGIISDEMLANALMQVSSRRNPFLRKDFVEKMKKLAAEKLSNYHINSSVFDIKLKNDLEGG